MPACHFCSHLSLRHLLRQKVVLGWHHLHSISWHRSSLSLWFPSPIPCHTQTGIQTIVKRLNHDHNALQSPSRMQALSSFMWWPWGVDWHSFLSAFLLNWGGGPLYFDLPEGLSPAESGTLGEWPRLLLHKQPFASKQYIMKIYRSPGSLKVEKAA